MKFAVIQVHGYLAVPLSVVASLQEAIFVDKNYDGSKSRYVFYKQEDPYDLEITIINHNDIKDRPPEPEEKDPPILKTSTEKDGDDIPF